MKNKKTIIALVLSISVGVASIGYSEQITLKEIEKYIPEHNTIIIKEKKEEIKEVEKQVVSGTIRTVTAYNVGDPYQTDDSPCIGAANTDLCEALEKGERHCAANFVPLGTVLWIQHYGKCLVSDRMNRRYTNRVDIAMSLEEKQRAKNFGVQNLFVEILE